MDTEHFKTKLEEELKEVEGELEVIGSKNPQVKNGTTDWEAKPGDADADAADDMELAEKIEEYEDNTAILKNLEIRFNAIKLALKKIEEGRYGLCEVCGKEIEQDRLEANPSSATCKEHMNG